jgi:hypothetical protein
VITDWCLLLTALDLTRSFSKPCIQACWAPSSPWDTVCVGEGGNTQTPVYEPRVVRAVEEGAALQGSKTAGKGSVSSTRIHTQGCGTEDTALERSGPGDQYKPGRGVVGGLQFPGLPQTLLPSGHCATDSSHSQGSAWSSHLPPLARVHTGICSCCSGPPHPRPVLPHSIWEPGHRPAKLSPSPSLWFLRLVVGVCPTFGHMQDTPSQKPTGLFSKG